MSARRMGKSDESADEPEVALRPVLAFMIARVVRGAKQGGRLEPRATMEIKKHFPEEDAI